MQWFEASGLLYLSVVNGIAFLAFGLDKFFAVKKRFRISERTLLTLSAIGGCIGALVGMVLFHHKTGKTKFRYTIPFFFLLYLFLIIFYQIQGAFGVIA